MKHDTQLRAHALRVMGTVEKCLARIDEPEKLDALLHTLGRRHSAYNVKSEFVDVSIVPVLSLQFSWRCALDFAVFILDHFTFQLIGPQFVRAIEPKLQDHWTPEVEDAWLCLFKLASVIMQETMIS